MDMTKHTGSCHCGAVRFEAEVDLAAGVTRCNCTICTKTAWLAARMKPEQFRLLAGEEALGSYEWGGKVAKRHFCTKCGVYLYGKGYLEVLGGAFVSINVNALDGVEVNHLPVKHWDGRHNNWQAGMRDEPWAILT
jgi:hypothetical protein